jgi:hypothetical protein
MGTTTDVTERTTVSEITPADHRAVTGDGLSLAPTRYVGRPRGTAPPASVAAGTPTDGPRCILQQPAVSG